MLKNRSIESVGYHECADWFGEGIEASIAWETVQKVLQEWKVSSFEAGAVTDERFWDGGGRSRGGRGRVVVVCRQC